MVLSQRELGIRVIPVFGLGTTVSASVREKSGFGVVTELDCRLLTVLGNNQV